jgi:hypothetical protein
MIPPLYIIAGDKGVKRYRKSETSKNKSNEPSFSFHHKTTPIQFLSNLERETTDLTLIEVAVNS